MFNILLLNTISFHFYNMNIKKYEKRFDPNRTHAPTTHEG